MYLICWLSDNLEDVNNFENYAYKWCPYLAEYRYGEGTWYDARKISILYRIAAN